MPFIISWKLGATKVFHIARDEWIHGMKELKYTNLFIEGPINKQSRHFIENERYITNIGEIYIPILCRRNFR